MIRKGLADYLISKPAIRAIVNDRIYPVRIAPDKALPAIAWAKEPHRGYEFHLEGPADYELSLIRIDCAAKTYGQAWELAAAVKSALNGLQRVDIEQGHVDQCELIDSWDDVQTEQEAEELTAYVAVQVFEFMCQPVTAT